MHGELRSGSGMKGHQARLNKVGRSFCCPDDIKSLVSYEKLQEHGTCRRGYIDCVNIYIVYTYTYIVYICVLVNSVEIGFRVILSHPESIAEHSDSDSLPDSRPGRGKTPHSMSSPMHSTLYATRFHRIRHDFVCSILDYRSSFMGILKFNHVILIFTVLKFLESQCGLALNLKWFGYLFFLIKELRHYRREK